MNQTACERYDKSLKKAKPVPEGVPTPKPTSEWPEANRLLFERYKAYLYRVSRSEACITVHYIPSAGHALGLHDGHHETLEIDTLSEAPLRFIRAKGVGDGWLNNCRKGLNRFARFLEIERGIVVEGEPKPLDLSHYQSSLPDWLIDWMTRHQKVSQANWRQARLRQGIIGYWSSYSVFWKWLCPQYPDLLSVMAVTPQMVMTFMEERIGQGYKPSGVNVNLHHLWGLLRFMQQRGEPVPEALFHIPLLPLPEELPRFLTDEQVEKVQRRVELRVAKAETLRQTEDARLLRTAFYLLWHAGLRLSEAEELRLGDLDLKQKQAFIRQGKGKRDRVVYLTDVAIAAIQETIRTRGTPETDHLLLYRETPVTPTLLGRWLQGVGEETGVKVTAYRLRHTFATQLVNAGCPIVTVQALMGHKRLQTTLIYAKVHDHKVERDYLDAMRVVESRFRLGAVAQKPPTTTANAAPHQLIHLLAQLPQDGLTDKQMGLLQQVHQRLQNLAS